jgi:hypothetical protein
MKGGITMKFVVLKVEDIEKYCSFEQHEQLSDICSQVEGGRMEEGKNAENRYFVVNTDEPYAGEVKAVIEKHEGEKVTLD